MKTTLLKMLTHSGHGSRKDVSTLIKQGLVSINDELQNNPKNLVETKDLQYKIGESSFVFYEKIYLALYKPKDFECSHLPTHHESVFKLLPKEFVARNVQACGRLDADTTGLLIFTDDGTFNQKLTSPKKKVPKTYLVTLKHKVTDEFMKALFKGVLLKDSPTKVMAAKLTQINDKQIELTISEGRYHQVKRMVAAASNRVENLKRISIGDLKLESLNLEIGEFTVLEESLQTLLF